MANIPMRILTDDGVEDVDVRSPKVRSTIGSYWNAVGRFLSNGDERALRDFEGVRVAGRILLTDPDLIEMLARRGETDIDEIYED